MAGHHKKVMFDLVKTWGSLLVSIATGAISAFAFVEAQLQSRIDAAIAAHNEDRNGAAHPRLSSRLEALDSSTAAARRAIDPVAAKLDRTDKSLYEMFWFRVGEKAVELEPNRDLRARARAAAQARFEVLVRDGDSLEDAYRRSLSTAAGLP